MIVKPTVKELLNYAENRYALVIAVSRRAREIAKENEETGNKDQTSPVTLAANELVEGKVHMVKEQSENDVAEEIKNEE